MIGAAERDQDFWRRDLAKYRRALRARLRSGGREAADALLDEWESDLRRRLSVQAPSSALDRREGDADADSGATPYRFGLFHVLRRELQDDGRAGDSPPRRPRKARPSAAKGEGQVFTPPALCRSLCRRVLDAAWSEERAVLERLCPEGSLAALEAELSFLQRLKVLDPACGAGFFLLAMMDLLAGRFLGLGDRIREAGGQTRALRRAFEALPAQFAGIDRDPQALSAAREALTALWMRHLRGADLAAPPGVAFTLIHANALVDDGAVDERAFIAERDCAKVAAQGGFDLVLGNPPYLSFSGRERADAPPAHLEFYRRRYRSAAAWTCAHGLFVERSLELLRPGGRCALLVPSLLAHGEGSRAVRQALLDACERIEVHDLGEEVFPGVCQPVSALIAVKSAAGERHAAEVTVYRRGVALPVDADHLEHDEQRRFAPPGADWRLGVAWEYESLGEAARDCGVHTGNARRRLLGPKRAAPHTAAVLEGRQIHPFLIETPRLYLDLKATPGEGEYFRLTDRALIRREKILLRQTARRFIAARDDQGRAFLNSCLAVFAPEGLDARYLTALLNSEVLHAWYRHAVPDADQRQFPQVKVRALREAPIIRAGEQDQRRIASLVEEIERLTPKIGADTRSFVLDEMLGELERLIADLYGQTRDEVQA